MGAFLNCCDGICIIGRDYGRKNFGEAKKNLVGLYSSDGK
jgi:hypothetical protein